MDLSETRVVGTVTGSITGSGTFTGPAIRNGGTGFTVSGTDSSEIVRLDVDATGFTTAHFVGQIRADTSLGGTLDGSGFDHLALTFTHHPVVASVAVQPRGDSTVPTGTAQFTATAFDQLGRPVAPQPIHWSLSDFSVASISATGLLTASAPGPVTVTATIAGVAGQAQITILRPVVSVTLPNLSTVVSAAVPVTVTLLDAAGSEITGRALTWSSSDPGVAAVSPSGIVTAFQTGSTDLTARVTLDGRSGLAHVTIRTIRPATLVAGANHSCGIEADGGAACWGDGQLGQLGPGMRTSVGAPLFVQGTLRFGSMTAGHRHTCGVATDGTAYCWGVNDFGQLGDGTTEPRTAPTPVAGGLRFVALVAGYDHTCGLVASGAAYCWGSNLLGEVGNGSRSEAPNATPAAVSGGLAFTSLAAGTSHTCGLSADSLAYCWGGNDFGSLGDGTRTSSSSPVLVAGGHRFAAIGAGAYHTCAISGTGEGFCWGNDSDAELGDSLGETHQDVPVAVRTTERFRSVAGGFNHTCAVAQSGQIYCWGGSENGQAGPNAGSRAYTPAPVGLQGSNVAAGGFHSCAATSQGAYCWGFNQLGQLGASSSTMQSPAPLRVSGQP
jgi:alpha-tubulin suppressor-like RCC1 family protein